ncbi:hypothetical protein IGI04_002657 [Brassica rapa subsp. trilocularis]|uniref:Uncharacterized protein n=1 Tax=Brassica rapa subsp. trilocularis TaxID=1813537 RepID=A0ABQ7NYB5_BRACM|nr:hypothetical protein IGI04_002657 [Brassica rapa subsp. trilocularis]
MLYTPLLLLPIFAVISLPSNSRSTADFSVQLLTAMPTFSAIALDRMLEPGAASTSAEAIPSTRSYYAKPPISKQEKGKETRPQMSPALYATPDAIPLPNSPSIHLNFIKNIHSIRMGIEKYLRLIAERKFTGKTEIGRMDRQSRVSSIYEIRTWWQLPACRVTHISTRWIDQAAKCRDACDQAMRPDMWRTWCLLACSQSMHIDSQPCGARGVAAHASGAMRTDTRTATRLVPDWLMFPINFPRLPLILTHTKHFKVSSKRERESKERKIDTWRRFCSSEERSVLVEISSRPVWTWVYLRWSRKGSDRRSRVWGQGHGQPKVTSSELAEVTGC